MEGDKINETPGTQKVVNQKAAEMEPFCVYCIHSIE